MKKLMSSITFKIFSIICIVFLCWYSIRVINSDLLTGWRKSGGIMGGGSSKEYLINSSNGQEIYVPSFLLPLLKFDYDQRDKQLSQLKNYFTDTRFKYRASIAGKYDEDTIIFTELIQGDGGYNMYKYSIKNNKFTFLFHDKNLTGCIAGKGKIFYTVSVVGEGWKNELIDAIYQYRLEDGESIKIGEYKTYARNIRLLHILK